MPGKIEPGSLAAEIEAHHPVAAALVRNLFGRLICCERREELRAHEFAILPDGFMTRGAFIERVRHYDNLPFVGQRGLKQQQAWKEAQIAERETEEGRLKPIEELVSEVQHAWREQFENPAPLYKQLAQVSELPSLKKKLTANIGELKLIDRAEFDEWEQQRVALQSELNLWEAEQRTLLTNQKHKDVERAEAALTAAAEAADKAKSAFEKVSDVSES